ncbi:hypothetical protein [Arthrobacter sp.]
MGRDQPEDRVAGGPHLQFIRINGTVVGSLAGLAIFALARLLGGSATDRA